MVSDDEQLRTGMRRFSRGWLLCAQRESVRYLRGRRRTCHGRSTTTPGGKELTGRSSTGDGQVEKQGVQGKFRSDSSSDGGRSEWSGP
jgi:hypothetical protein